MEKSDNSKSDLKFIRWFSQLNKSSVSTAGGKGANLGEMFNSGFPVPPGFAITAQAYDYFLKQTNLKQKIQEIIQKTDVDNTDELEKNTAQIRSIIIQSSLPKDLEQEILVAYNSLDSNQDVLEIAHPDALKILKKSNERIFVAVRSSATAEDSSEASFAGQQETFINVKGEKELLLSIKKVFASLYTARSVYYRSKKGFSEDKVLISAIIQKMVNSDKSGVIFSRNPIGNQDKIIIEAIFGQGEGIVSGRIKPDHYIVDRDLKDIDGEVADKKIAITRNSAGENIEIKLTPEKSKLIVLTEVEIKKLAQYALKLEEHYNKPQDIEFAIESGEIYIVQTRPITTLDIKFPKQYSKETIKGNEILSGLGASQGIASGKVKIIRDLKDLDKIQKGDILVTTMTNPDMVVTMQRSVAIITDEGGMTAHAAIVSREMGIPAVVGTQKATSTLKDGQIVTVDGFNGKVYEGKVAEDTKKEILPIVETKFKIKVNVDLPSSAERAAKTGIKSIGLLRIEGIIAEGSKHPIYYLKTKKIKDYENLIYNGIKKIMQYFDEAWVRTSDIRSDEFEDLEGSPKKEANPMLGFHGIRYSLKNKPILLAEINALTRISKEMKNKKIGIMLPQVISIEEVKEVKEILRNTNLYFGVMIETPAAVQIIEDLCNYEIKFISFGTNDLTQYTLAIDRGNEQTQYLYDEMHPAVLKQLKSVIDICKKYNVETSICGQAGNKKEMVEFLYKTGINGISTNADSSYEISKVVEQLEKKPIPILEFQSSNSNSNKKNLLDPKKININIQRTYPHDKRAQIIVKQALQNFERDIAIQNMNLFFNELEAEEGIKSLFKGVSQTSASENSNNKIKKNQQGQEENQNEVLDIF